MRNDYSYVLQVDGVFGRNKKPKQQSFVLLEGVEQNFAGTLIVLAQVKLAEIGFKSGRVAVIQQKVMLEETTDTSVQVSHELGDEVVVKLFDPAEKLDWSKCHPLVDKRA